jgi:ABC-2 type transport system permease protein
MANLFGTWTLFKRESKRFMKVYMQTILAPVISNLLFLSIFGLSLNGVVELVPGLSYLQFIVPGLVIMGIVNNAFQNPSSSMMIMKYQGIIHDLMIIPLKKVELLFGFISASVLRGLIVGGVTLISSEFFVDFSYHSITVILTSSILVSFFFSFVGLIVGVWADEFDRMAFIQNFILMPLIFLGGVFFPITNLPGVFQQLSALNPIVYMINLLRYGFTGYSEFDIALSFTVLGSLTFITGLAAYIILKKGWKLQT